MREAGDRVTRGGGLLEGFLARLRARKAMQLIDGSGVKCGRLLDIGCGSRPLFLLGSGFAERYGVDQVVDGAMAERYLSAGVHLVGGDISGGVRLAFDDGYFDAVTMLAVWEHVESSAGVLLLSEVRRVLADGGVLVMTTPSPWSSGVLSVMARVGLVSSEEIAEHKGLMGLKELRGLLDQAGFSEMRQGYFEFGLNSWAIALNVTGKHDAVKL